MQCQGIAYTWSFDMGLTSAESQKLSSLQVYTTSLSRQYQYNMRFISSTLASISKYNGDISSCI
jgi:hypothetical protein